MDMMHVENDVSGTVTDASNKPLAGICVTAQSNSSDFITDSFFGNATTNTPDDPERIDSVKWIGSSGVQMANLAASGGRSCGDGREWWGESYGATEGEPPYLVAGG